MASGNCAPYENVLRVKDKITNELTPMKRSLCSNRFGMIQSFQDCGGRYLKVVIAPRQWCTRPVKDISIYCLELLTDFVHNFCSYCAYCYYSGSVVSPVELLVQLSYKLKLSFETEVRVKNCNYFIFILCIFVICQKWTELFKMISSARCQKNNGCDEHLHYCIESYEVNINYDVHFHSVQR